MQTHIKVSYADRRPDAAVIGSVITVATIPAKIQTMVIFFSMRQVLIPEVFHLAKRTHVYPRNVTLPKDGNDGH